MAIKTILAVIQSTKDIERVLDCVGPLAERLGSHVTGTHAEPMTVPYATDVGFADVSLIEAQVAANRQRSDELEKKFQARMSAAGLSAEWRSVESFVGDSALAALNGARTADLIVAAQVDPADEIASTGELDTLLYEAGRPVLLVPHNGAVITRFGKVTVAWNGTRESARATFDALPFLLEANSVEILVVNPPESRHHHHSHASDGSDIAATLDRQGVNVTLSGAHSAGNAVAAVIEQHVVAAGSDLLVMGAFSHSRLREWLFGGVTRSMMGSMPVATFMSR